MRKLSLTAYALVLVCAPVIAGSLAGAPVVFKSGKWSVLRTVDSMTDKTDCTGIYDGDYNVQLVKDRLFLRVKGGPQTFRYRFDEEPPVATKFVSDAERRIDLLQIEGEDFQRLLRAHRLRYSVYNLLNRTVEGDMTLAGVAEAVQHIDAGCPGDAVAPAAAPSGVHCSDASKALLKARGMSDADLIKVCGK